MTKETTTGWEEEIPHLKIELMADGCLLLTCPDNYGNGDSMLTVHPVQLRFMAEKLGLAREVSASDAEMIRTLRGQNATAVRAVNTLVRRMRSLQARIDHIQMWLCTHSDTQHADLSYEMDYTTGTMQLCDEFCIELDEMVERVSEVTLAALPATLAATAPATPVTFEVPAPVTAPATPGNASGNHVTPSGALQRQETPAAEASGKACANPSGKASAKASVKASEPGTGSLFGGAHG